MGGGGGGWWVAYRILVSAPVPFGLVWVFNWVGLGWDWGGGGLGLDNYSMNLTASKREGSGDSLLGKDIGHTDTGLLLQRTGRRGRRRWRRITSLGPSKDHQSGEN